MRVNFSTDLAGFEDVTQVTEQAVADVSHGMGNASKRLAQRNTGCGAFHSEPRRIKHGLWQADRAAKGLKGQAGVAQMAADIQVVPCEGTAAQYGLSMGNFPHHGDGNVQRTSRGVTTYQFASMGIGQLEKPFGKAGQPMGIGMGQRQGQKEGLGDGTACGQVTQIHSQCFVTQMVRVNCG